MEEIIKHINPNLPEDVFVVITSEYIFKMYKDMYKDPTLDQIIEDLSNPIIFEWVITNAKKILGSNR